MTGREATSVAAMAVTAAGVLMLATAWASAAPVVDPVLFNATTNAGGDDPAGLGTGFSATSMIGGDTVEDAFGNNDGGIESDNFLFADGRTPDNGDADMNAGDETIDVIGWSTTSVVVIDGYRLGVAGDGGGAPRGTELVLFNVENEQDDFWDNNAAAATTDRLFAIPQVGNSFALSVTHTTSAGARVFEIDAIVTDTSAAVVNTTIFNATTNTGGDQPAGLSFGFSHSTLVGANADTVQDAFGNNDGAIEGSTLIFENGGTADNGNNVFGDGGETVDFIEWSTLSLVQLDGYRLELGNDGGEGAPRSTDLVRFFVDGVLVDIFDANGHAGVFDRLFAGGTVVGDLFRIELTRTVDGGAGGPRLIEIDALNALAVPTPGALPAGLALMALAASRRRRR